MHIQAMLGANAVTPHSLGLLQQRLCFYRYGSEVKGFTGTVVSGGLHHLGFSKGFTILEVARVSPLYDSGDFMPWGKPGFHHLMDSEVFTTLKLETVSTS